MRKTSTIVNLVVVLSTVLEKLVIDISFAHPTFKDRMRSGGRIINSFRKVSNRH